MVRSRHNPHPIKPCNTNTYHICRTGSQTAIIQSRRRHRKAKQASQVISGARRFSRLLEAESPVPASLIRGRVYLVKSEPERIKPQSRLWRLSRGFDCLEGRVQRTWAEHCQSNNARRQYPRRFKDGALYCTRSRVEDARLDKAIFESLDRFDKAFHRMQYGNLSDFSYQRIHRQPPHPF